MEPIFVVSSLVLWLLVLFNLLLTLGLIRKVNVMPQLGGIPQPAMLSEGSQAPAFTAQTLDGSEVTQLDYTNKELAMVFVSSTCGPCRDKMPELQALYPKAQKAGVELLIVNLEAINATKTYVEDLKLSVPILSAPRGINPLNDMYKIPGTPSFYIIDRKGKISAAGFLDAKWEALKTQWENQQ